MTIYINSTFKNDSQTATSDQKVSDELKKAFEEVFANDDTSDQIKWVDDQTVEVNGVAPMNLHTFTLKAEELGKEVTYQKKTIIQIK